MKTWEHDELAEDLGDTKGTNFLNVHLGSPYLQSSVQRADVLEIKPSYTRFCVSIYEVKISRSDFQSDIRSEKWRGYLDHCHRFYFAVPAGMVNKQEVPPEAGLIVRGETGWVTQKAAKPRDTEIPYMTLLSVAFARQRQNFRENKRSQLHNAIRWHRSRKEIYRSFSKEIGEALKNKDEYFQKSREYQNQLDSIDEAISKALGLPEGRYWSSTFELEKIVRKIAEKARW
jgi:hypothetical protein